MFLKKIFVVITGSPRVRSTCGVVKEVNDMSKSQDAKKNKKTAPQKTAKEKKLGKQEKKKK